MRPFVRSLVPLVSLVIAACGAGASKAPTVHAPPASVTAAQAPKPDLSPVAEPDGVVVVGRIRNVQETLRSAERMASIPLSLENKIREALQAKNVDIFKLDATVDFVLALDPDSTDEEPKFHAAISLPLRDLEEARIAHELHENTITPLVPGVYRSKLANLPDDGKKEIDENNEKEIEEKGAEKDEDETPDERYCDIALAVGDAPARLVCSSSTEELDKLRPWMTRGLPNTPRVNSDFFTELRVTPFRDRYLPTVRAKLPGAELLAKNWLASELDIRDPELLAIPGEILEESVALVDDVDRITFTGSLDPNTSQMSFRGTIAFRSTSAWLTRVYTDTNDEAGPPPETFWRLPRDADSATYARSADPKLYEGVLKSLRLLTSHLLTQAPLSAPSKSAIEGFVASMPVLKATVVTARGTIPGTYSPKKKDTPTALDAIRELEQLTNASVGWSVIGVDAPAQPYIDWLKSGVRAYERVLNDAKKNKDIGKEVRDAKWVPSLRVRNGLAGYPRGTTGLDVTVRFDSKGVWAMTIGRRHNAPEHPKGAAAPGTITLHLVVVPDGANRTWLGMSTNRSLLREKLRTVTTSGSTDATIASLSGLETLRTTPTVAAGFMNYGNVLNQAIRSWQDSDTGVDPKVVEETVASLPNRLRTPVLMFNRGTAGAAPTNEIEFRIQRGSVEDIAGFVKYAMSPEGKKVLEILDAIDPSDVSGSLDKTE